MGWLWGMLYWGVLYNVHLNQCTWMFLHSAPPPGIEPVTSSSAAECHGHRATMADDIFTVVAFKSRFGWLIDWLVRNVLQQHTGYVRHCSGRPQINFDEWGFFNVLIYCPIWMRLPGTEKPLGNLRHKLRVTPMYLVVDIFKLGVWKYRMVDLKSNIELNQE